MFHGLQFSQFYGEMDRVEEVEVVQQVSFTVLPNAERIVYVGHVQRERECSRAAARNIGSSACIKAVARGGATLLPHGKSLTM